MRPSAATGAESRLRTGRFSAAADAAGFAIPHMAPALISKYVADLRGLGLL